MTNRSMKGSQDISNFSKIFENDEDFDFGVLADMIEPDEGGSVTRGGTSKATSTKNSSVTNGDFGDNIGDASEDNAIGINESRGVKQKSPTKRRASTIDRRRERNRVLARKTRLRKKFFFESLQVQVAQLATENQNLKQVVRENLDVDTSEKILTQCNSEIPAALTSPTQKKQESYRNQALKSPTGNIKIVLQNNDYELYSTIRCAQRSFIINYVGVQTEVKLAKADTPHASLPASPAVTLDTSKRVRTPRSDNERNASIDADMRTSMKNTDNRDDVNKGLGLISGPAVSINGTSIDHIGMGDSQLKSSPSSENPAIIPGIHIAETFSIDGRHQNDFRFTMLGDESRRSRSNSLTLLVAGDMNVPEIMPEPDSQKSPKSDDNAINSKSSVEHTEKNIFEAAHISSPDSNTSSNN